jgi:hypothetical protein
MATVYDQTKDPYFQGAEATVNRTSVAVVTSDTVDFASYPKNVTLLTAGTVSCIPLKNPDTGPGTTTFGSLLAGYTIPFRVRRINATGSSATFTASYD